MAKNHPSPMPNFVLWTRPFRVAVSSLVLAMVLGCSSDQLTTPETLSTGTLTGTVSSNWWGTSVRVTDAAVRLEGSSPMSTTSDASGRYRFDGIPAGTYTMTVDGGNEHESWSGQAIVSAGTVQALNITLERRTAVIRGTVVNRFDDSAFTTAIRVEFVPAERDTVVSLLTDNVGDFTLPLPMGSYAPRFKDPAGTSLFDFERDSVVDLRDGSTELKVRVLPMADEDFLIDFESPKLPFMTWNRTIHPYSDEVSGTRFSTTAPPAGASYVPVTGLVVNAFTSACAPPSDMDQKLGTGVAGSGASGSTSSVGFSANPIRADFSAWLPPGTVLTAEFQSLATAFGRIHLLGANGDELNVVSDSLGPPQGTCVQGRGDAGRKKLSVSINSPVASLIFDVVGPNGSSGYVWVLDDVQVTVGR